MESQECVILLHGLGRTHRSMRKLEIFLQKQGYHVWNRSYPSTRQSVERSALHISEGLSYCQQYKPIKIHFVTHSLGGILWRYCFQDNLVGNIGNTVMLAPPNHGSEVVDFLKDKKLFQWALGPAGQQLGTEQVSLPNRLNGINANVGIIAGEKSSDPWFSYFFSGKNDGKVSVNSARLEGMLAFKAVDCGHTFIMNDKSVHRYILYFLKHAAFEPAV